MMAIVALICTGASSASDGRLAGSALRHLLWALASAAAACRCPLAREAAVTRKAACPREGRRGGGLDGGTCPTETCGSTECHPWQAGPPP